MTRGTPDKKTCSVEGCDQPCARIGRGRGHQLTICMMHYRERQAEALDRALKYSHEAGEGDGE